MTAESDYVAHLATGNTTRALCWRVERADGEVFGFTDHDAPISFGGLTYEARSAFEGSELSDSLGLAVDDQDVSGALASDRITAADLIRGIYDGARVEIWGSIGRPPARGNCKGPSLSARSSAARSGSAPKCGPRSPASGRRPARATFPNARRRSATPVAGSTSTCPSSRDGHGRRLARRRLHRDRPRGLCAGWFARGVLTWTSGANDGLRSEVRGFTAGITGRTLALWRDPPFPIEVGDHFTVTAGCDKSFATCKAKFANAANFRGFPHMPGEGFAAEYAVKGDPRSTAASRIADAHQLRVSGSNR